MFHSVPWSQIPNEQCNKGQPSCPCTLAWRCRAGASRRLKVTLSWNAGVTFMAILSTRFHGCFGSGLCSRYVFCSVISSDSVWPSLGAGGELLCAVGIPDFKLFYSCFIIVFLFILLDSVVNYPQVVFYSLLFFFWLCYIYLISCCIYWVLETKHFLDILDFKCFFQ